jgi:hypothetical protein
VADWHEIARLISQRWPSWEPNEQERADWRRVIGYREFDLIDEAMLAVRTKYSSAVPALKWILAEYRRLKDEKYQRQREQQHAESHQSAADEMAEVQRERKACLEYLLRQSEAVLTEAAAHVRGRYGWALPTSSVMDPDKWGWAMRYAVALHLRDTTMGGAA